MIDQQTEQKPDDNTASNSTRLLSDLLPEMEVRVKGLGNMWPGPQTTPHLEHNKDLVRRIKEALGR